MNCIETNIHNIRTSIQWLILERTILILSILWRQKLFGKNLLSNILQQRTWFLIYLDGFFYLFGWHPTMLNEQILPIHVNESNPPTHGPPGAEVCHLSGQAKRKPRQVAASCGSLFVWSFFDTPWKIHMEPTDYISTNHPFWKEMIFQSSMIMFIYVPCGICPGVFQPPWKTRSFPF